MAGTISQHDSGDSFYLRTSTANPRILRNRAPLEWLRPHVRDFETGVVPEKECNGYGVISTHIRTFALTLMPGFYGEKE